jgi:site-specific recombinase XerD
MLESYFVKPQTVDRVRASWIGVEVERYVAWMTEHGYSSRCVARRVPLVVAFGEFARARGVGAVEDLAGHVEEFVAERAAGYRGARRCGNVEAERQVAREIRGPIEQMLRLVVPGFLGSGQRHRRDPFADALPGFFDYLAGERGLRPATIVQYRYHVGCFEGYLDRIGVSSLGELSPPLLSAYVADLSGTGLSKATVGIGCSMLRVFLRYTHREGAIARDLSRAVEGPQVYRLADIPRSISWEEVGQVLACVDRRTAIGKRDWAILLLLATYGLRSREIAALTLDDIDWKHERLAIPSRKAGHSTAFPLSLAVGEALVDYLKHGRPQTADRRVFFRALAPVAPLEHTVISDRAGHYLRKAGIDVARPGSHTLRHSCVQRLVDADFSLKSIGDFVGHRSPRSTEVYRKVAVESLRAIALGDGEEVLS